MDRDVSTNRISRRRMLKRIGAGAAVAWSAPVLSSLRTPAFAQYPTVCSGEDFECGGPFTQCGTDEIGVCFCDRDTAGTTRCLANICVGDCTTNADCGANEFCIPTTCCTGSQCIPACGTRPARTRRGGSPLGAS